MSKAAVRLADLIRKDDPIIRYEGDGVDILRQPSKPVIKFDEDLPELIDQMESIMRGANGVGLAAPQLGIMHRIFVYDSGDGFNAVVNPKILHRKGEQLGVEGCLSMPGLQGDVMRANEVVIKGVDQFGKPVRIRGEGLTARVIQHEIDHLDGVLFIDRAEPSTLHWITAEEADSPYAENLTAAMRE